MVSSSDEGDAAREVLLSIICAMLAVFWPRTKGEKAEDRRQEAGDRRLGVQEAGVRSPELRTSNSEPQTPNPKLHRRSCRRVTYKIFSRTAISARREPG